MRAAETRFATYRENSAPANARAIPIPGFGPTPGPEIAANELVRVEQAVASGNTKGRRRRGKANPDAKRWEVGKKHQAGIFANTGHRSEENNRLAFTCGDRGRDHARDETSYGSSGIAGCHRGTSGRGSLADRHSPRRDAVTGTGDTALASTTGGGTWKIFPPGKMPAGRLINTSDLGDVAERGLAGERVYLRGQFVVNFAESNRAVLRPRSKLAESVLHLGAPSSTRIIVEFPSGVTPPPQGSTVNRDEARPYEITEVRKQSDGQLNVFVREIMQ